MVAKARLDGDITSTEMTGSTSDSSVLDPGNRLQDSKKNKSKDQSNKSVPFHKLFSFADSWDYLLMFVGTITAIGNGISMPLMTIIIGDTIDAFGGNVDNKQVVHEVSKVTTSPTLWNQTSV